DLSKADVNIRDRRTALAIALPRCEADRTGSSHLVMLVALQGRGQHVLTLDQGRVVALQGFLKSLQASPGELWGHAFAPSPLPESRSCGGHHKGLEKGLSV